MERKNRVLNGCLGLILLGASCGVAVKQFGSSEGGPQGGESSSEDVNFFTASYNGPENMMETVLSQETSDEFREHPGFIEYEGTDERDQITIRINFLNRFNQRYLARIGK